MVMNRPRTSRQSVPRPAALGLRNDDRTRADLEDLGWYNEESLQLLWGLAGASDPKLALVALVRLKGALDELEQDGKLENWATWSGLDEAMRAQVPLRTRMFALLGGSSALGDHLVAHPEKWVLLLSLIHI